jgi:hypothetical protein
MRNWHSGESSISELNNIDFGCRISSLLAITILHGCKGKPPVACRRRSIHVHNQECLYICKFVSTIAFLSGTVGPN